MSASEHLGEKGNPRGVSEHIQYLGRKTQTVTSEYHCTVSQNSVLLVVRELTENSWRTAEMRNID